MRHQDRIYIQNDISNVRNKDILNYSTSSDICVFSEPLFNVSGATKIVYNDKTINFSGISYNNILTGATFDCFTQQSLSASCLDVLTWQIRVIENDNVAYSGDFHTSNQITGNTATQTQFLNAVNNGFTLLGYDYTQSGTSFTITKPFGVKDLDVDICINTTLTDSCSLTATCSGDCTTVASTSFNFIKSGDTGVYIIDTATTLTFTFDFTGNTESFTNSPTSFKYEIYKFNHTSNVFNPNRLLSSNAYPYSTFSGTSALTQTISISDLKLDGDYLIKGYYDYVLCTDILGRLGISADTLTFKNGELFGLYEPTKDWYFIAITKAQTPIFQNSNEEVLPTGSLHQQVVIPSVGSTLITITDNVIGDFVLTLNGLVLANEFDYSFSGNLVTLSAATAENDIITIIYTTTGANNLNSDVIDVLTIPQGAQDEQGTNKIYLNTTTGKYEIYTTLTPTSGNQILVMLNGVTLANNVDYYQSISNPNRLILEGTIYVNDIITIVYFANPNVVNGISTNNPNISWLINTAPISNDGIFVLEVSSGITFNILTTSATTNYVIGQSIYNSEITITGSVGTNLYYRVKNNKKYVSIKGDIIDSIAYSEIVPITLISNEINSY